MTSPSPSTVPYWSLTPIPNILDVVLVMGEDEKEVHINKVRFVHRSLDYLVFHCII